MGAISLSLNLLAIGQMVDERFLAIERRDLVPPGEFEGLHAGEAMLILDSLLVVSLLCHALWHRIGAFGFLALFVFNHVRFAETS